MHICYIVAMAAEAQPFIDQYGVAPRADFFSPLPCQLYVREFDGGDRLSVVVNGEQHGSSLVGCEAAAVTTLAAIERLHPDIVVNSGTCGAWLRHGAEIAKVYIGSGVMFHDRRVMGDDEWATQSLGNYPLSKLSAAVAEALGLAMGKVTTGSSLDLQPCDAEIIEQHGGELKDMEAASVAFVCSLMATECMLVKSVTDLIDGPGNTLEEFRANLRRASESLAAANVQVVDWLLTHKA